MEAYQVAFPEIDFSMVQPSQLDSVALVYRHPPEARKTFVDFKQKIHKTLLMEEVMTEIIATYTRIAPLLQSDEMSPRDAFDRLMHAGDMYNAIGTAPHSEEEMTVGDICKELVRILMLPVGGDVGKTSITNAMSSLAKAYFSGNDEELSAMYENLRIEGTFVKSERTYSELNSIVQTEKDASRASYVAMCITTPDTQRILVNLRQMGLLSAVKCATPVLDLILKYQDKLGGSDEDPAWTIIKENTTRKHIGRHEFGHFLARNMRKTALIQ